MKEKINRRDFIKLSGLALSAIALPLNISLPILTENKLELCDNIQSADKITTWIYPYPSFNEKGKSLPMKIFEDQLAYLNKANYQCLTSQQYSQFLKGEGSFNPRSVVLGFNVDEDKNIKSDGIILNVWRDEVIPLLRKYSLHGMWFINPSAVESIENGITWKELDKWNKEGLISITEKYVKSLAITTLSPLVVDYNDETSSSMPGYGYPVLGTMHTKDYHRSFNEVLAAEGTQVTVESTSSVQQVEITSLDLLPDIFFRNQLMKPTIIVLHTDDQDGDNWKNWNASLTKKALFSMNKAVHFSVDMIGSLQLSKIWWDQCKSETLFPMIEFSSWPPRGGAAHFNACAISIEMAGRGYNRYFDKDTPNDLKNIIYRTANHATDLTSNLIQILRLDINSVFGHYQVSLRGKTDPGERFMKDLFIPLLYKKLKTNIPTL